MDGLISTFTRLPSTWGAASRDVQVDMIEDFEDERIPDDPAAYALDRTLTARAFLSDPRLLGGARLYKSGDLARWLPKINVPTPNQKK